ncbi:30S ribosomal protein S12 methylthiotransferase RimO [bacterium]|nr:30S ribosomal protein S12 methylthiotransferase RimO [bacterium]
MKLAFVDLGCPKNTIDLEMILAGLDKQLRLVDDAREADAVLVNTCAFIESAKQESIDTILELGRIKKERPEFKILVSGCLPQRYPQQLAPVLPEVSVFFDSVDAAKTRRQLRRFLHLPASCSTLRRRVGPPHYAYLRLAEGCDNRCSYCAIPLIKGRYVSRSQSQIIREAKSLVEQGCREINLVAQDTTYYGRERRQPGALVPLLEKLSEIDGLRWIRLLYTHPAHYTAELIRCIAQLDKVVKYVDLPIQHISDRVLERMHRRTTRKQIESLIDRLRAAVPDLAIRTTVLVGFPGETEREFQKLLHFIEAVRFERLGVFTYSEEDGTRAARLRNSVPFKTKQRRYLEIMETQAGLSQERQRNLIGRSLTVLIDEVVRETQQSIGRTMWDAPEIDQAVIFDAALKPGRFYSARVIGADLFDLFARTE